VIVVRERFAVVENFCDGGKFLLWKIIFVSYTKFWYEFFVASSNDDHMVVCNFYFIEGSNIVVILNKGLFV
jgi:hypothetical protein